VLVASGGGAVHSASGQPRPGSALAGAPGLA